MPVTVLQTYRVFDRFPALLRAYRWLPVRAVRKIVLRRTCSPQPMWLAPYPYYELEDLALVWRRAEEAGVEVAVMNFHSSELMPGGSPFRPTPAVDPRTCTRVSTVLQLRARARRAVHGADGRCASSRRGALSRCARCEGAAARRLPRQRRRRTAAGSSRRGPAAGMATAGLRAGRRSVRDAPARPGHPGGGPGAALAPRPCSRGGALAEHPRLVARRRPLVGLDVDGGRRPAVSPHGRAPDRRHHPDGASVGDDHLASDASAWRARRRVVANSRRRPAGVGRGAGEGRRGLQRLRLVSPGGEQRRPRIPRRPGTRGRVPATAGSPSS